MKRNHILPNIFLLLLLYSLIFASCQQRPHQLETTALMTADSFRIMAVDVMPEYNSISDITLLLINTDVAYHPELVNSIENVESYMNNELLSAANIGVYIVDLAYAYLFEDDNTAVGSYIAAMALAQNFKVVETFINNFLSNYSVNEAELDTILSKLEQNVQASAVHLTNDNEIRLYSALLTGTFIEKIFLLYSTISRYPEGLIPEDKEIENLQRLIWIASGQKNALGELNIIIDNYAIPEEYQFYRHELINLGKQMNEAVFLRDTSIVRSVEIVRSPEFLNLCNEIVKIRGSITEPGEQSE